MTGWTLAERARRRWRRDVVGSLEARVLAPIRRRVNRQRTFRPLFVAGAMGSGTTLLAFSLGQRFDVSCTIAESSHQVASDSFLHAPGVDEYPSIRDYEEAMLPKASWSVAEGRRHLLDLYRGYARGLGDRAIDKGPNTNLVRAAFLAECFPDAQFVGVFRDPVANVEGLRRKWPSFRREPLEESVRFYRSIHERFLREAEGLRDRLVMVEYEDLVERYEEVLAWLGRRLGLAASTAPRRLPTRGNVEGRGIRNVTGGRIGVVSDANASAYARLSEDEAAAIRRELEPLHRVLQAWAESP
jgi:hypothetical protein